MNDAKAILSVLYCARRDEDDEDRPDLYDDALAVIREISAAYDKGFEEGYARGIRDTHLEYGAAGFQWEDGSKGGAKRQPTYQELLAAYRRAQSVDHMQAEHLTRSLCEAMEGASEDETD